MKSALWILMCFLWLWWFEAGAEECGTNIFPGALIHPGLLHTASDLDRIRQKLAAHAEPWTRGFEVLQRHPQSQSDWKLRGPAPSVVRGSRSCASFDADGNAAYQNALMWALTGREAHVQKAVEILNAWSVALVEITGRDKELGASLGAFKYVNAAELIRHTYRRWTPSEIARFEKMLRTVIAPVIRDFATFANGNWDAGCEKTLLAIGVFCDDRDLCNRSVNYFLNGSGNGRLTHYIINPAGQCQESGRDQQHTQLGLAHLAETCEIAWHQGVDLYGASENRLLRGFEYTAKYNLGQAVPFEAARDTTRKYFAKEISTKLRGTFRPIYEMIWNHYEKRAGLEAPLTRAVADKIRPEGAAFGADHPGFGTLLFTLDFPVTAAASRTADVPPSLAEGLRRN